MFTLYIVIIVTQKSMTTKLKHSIIKHCTTCIELIAMCQGRRVRCRNCGYMTILIRTFQIPTIQILRKMFKGIYLKI